MKILPLVLGSLLVLNGCATHALLPNAPSTGDYDERSGFYDEYKPLAFHQTRPDAPRFLLLQNGTRVDEPEDLLPLVDEDSATALAVERFQEAQLAQIAVKTGVYSGLGIGYAVMLTAFLPLATLDLTERTGEEFNNAMFTSTGSLMVGISILLASIVGLLIVKENQDEVERERDTAFLTYDRSLRKKLNLPKDTTSAAPLAPIPSMPSPSPAPAAPSPK